MRVSASLVIDLGAGKVASPVIDFVVGIAQEHWDALTPGANAVWQARFQVADRSGTPARHQFLPPRAPGR